ncbi:MAG: hypothetical protein AAFQ80_16445 [Cyanobacteria bacterium J06621_8]
MMSLTKLLIIGLQLMLISRFLKLSEVTSESHGLEVGWEEVQMDENTISPLQDY